MNGIPSKDGFWHRLIGQKLSLFLLLGLTVLLGRFEVFGPNGYLALLQKQREYDNAVKSLQHLQAQNRDLHHSIQQLKSDPTAIERIAREQLHLTKPGEVVFTYGGQHRGVDDIRNSQAQPTP